MTALTIDCPRDGHVSKLFLVLLIHGLQIIAVRFLRFKAVSDE